MGESQARLRNDRWLIPRLDNQVHLRLHNAVAFVPLLDNRTADNVLREFGHHHRDHFSAVDDLCLAIEDVIAQPRTSGLERSMGGLVIASLEQQKSFLKEGMLHATLL